MDSMTTTLANTFRGTFEILTDQFFQKIVMFPQVEVTHKGTKGHVSASWRSKKSHIEISCQYPERWHYVHYDPRGKHREFQISAVYRESKGKRINTSMQTKNAKYSSVFNICVCLIAQEENDFHEEMELLDLFWNDFLQALMNDR